MIELLGEVCSDILNLPTRWWFGLLFVQGGIDKGMKRLLVWKSGGIVRDVVKAESGVVQEPHAVLGWIDRSRILGLAETVTIGKDRHIFAEVSRYRGRPLGFFVEEGGNGITAVWTLQR